MTLRQKIDLELIALRKRAGELMEIAEPTDANKVEVRELKGKITDANERLELIIASEPNATPTQVGEVEDQEAKELRELREASSLMPILRVAAFGSRVEGQTAEFQQHFGCKEHEVPLSLLMEHRTQAPLEVRDVTPGPTESTQQLRIISDIFPRGLANHLRIETPSIPAGQQATAIIQTSAAATAAAKGGSVDSTTGALNSVVLNNRRLQAELDGYREDFATVPALETAFRRNLTDALSDGLDKQILVGSGGFLADGLTEPSDPGAATGFADFKATVFDALDGKYAVQPSDLNMVIGSETISRMSSEYRNANVSDNAWDTLRSLTGNGVRLSANVPDAASNVQGAIIARSLTETHATAPVWENVSFIRDESTDARTGIIRIVAYMLFNFKVIRSAGFVRLKFDLR